MSLPHEPPPAPEPQERESLRAEKIVDTQKGADMTGIGTSQEPLSVTSAQRGHAVHLRLVGEIDMASTSLLEGWLHTAESNGSTAIVVDLEQVTFMDAGGLRVFLRAAERATRSGRAFELMGAPRVVRRILRITGTTHLLGSDALGLSPARPPTGPSGTQASPVFLRAAHRRTTRRPPPSSLQ